MAVHGVFALAQARVGFEADQVQLAVMHAALGGEGIGKSPYVGGGPLQDDGLDAVRMIEVAMHGGHRQVMMVVLQVSQAL
jgi:hypothetical protein